MERIYRVFFLAIFVLGFVGAVASADKAPEDDQSSLVTLIQDLRLAQEANAINAGRWEPQDLENNHEDGLAKVEEIFAKK